MGLSWKGYYKDTPLTMGACYCEITIVSFANCAGQAEAKTDTFLCAALITTIKSFKYMRQIIL